MPKHVVVHARTSKRASKHVEFVQHTAHAPNVLGQIRHKCGTQSKALTKALTKQPAICQKCELEWQFIQLYSCFEQQRETASKMLI